MEDPDLDQYCDVKEVVCRRWTPLLWELFRDGWNWIYVE